MKAFEVLVASGGLLLLAYLIELAIDYFRPAA